MAPDTATTTISEIIIRNSVTKRNLRAIDKSLFVEKKIEREKINKEGKNSIIVRKENEKYE
jgi:hypothetical protein